MCFDLLLPFRAARVQVLAREALTAGRDARGLVVVRLRPGELPEQVRLEVGLAFRFVLTEIASFRLHS